MITREQLSNLTEDSIVYEADGPIVDAVKIVHLDSLRDSEDAYAEHFWVVDAFNSDRDWMSYLDRLFIHKEEAILAALNYEYNGDNLRLVAIIAALKALEYVEELPEPLAKSVTHFRAAWERRFQR